MSNSKLLSSDDNHDKMLQSQGNDHTNDTAFWNIGEEGKEKKDEDECAVVAVKSKESDHVIITPNYKSDFTGFLTEKEFSIETGKHIKNDFVSKRTCFNCLGDHNMSDCTMKKDYQAIARNRTSFLGKRPSNVRYHEDGENKFSNFEPGVLSDNLLNALGMKHFQSPDFIYRMRVLGYPPGWLKEAEVERSTISVIDGSGKALSHPDDEEGETDINITKYQPEKFIAFPGFNVPFPSHIKDESSLLEYPPMQEHHKRENFLKFMKLNKSDLAKRKRVKENVPSDDLTTLPTRGDMDVDDSATTQSVIELNKSIVEIKTKEDGEISSDSNDCKSNSVKPPPISTKVSKTLKRVSEGESSSDSSPVLTKKVKRHHRSSSKGFTLGVCIPESITPFNALPEATKWSVDVSDHILFDNLPDSLGTWKKMRGIVKNVQAKLQNLGAAQKDS